MFNLLKPLVGALLQITFISPLLLLIKFRYTKKQKHLLLLIALMIITENLIAFGFWFKFSSAQQWNWIGRSASLIASVLFISFNPILSRNDIGFVKYLKPFSTYPIIGSSVILLILRLLPKLFSGNFHHFTGLETFAFQATLPGFSEEIFYRGIILGLLNKIYPASIIIFKAKIGWGVLIVTVLFGLIHGINLDKHWHLLFSSQKFSMTAGLGLALAWLKQRSGSLLPSIIFHNLWNVIVFS